MGKFKKMMEASSNISGYTDADEGEPDTGFIRGDKKYPSLLTAIKICKGLEKITGARWDTHALNLIRIVEEETNEK